MFNIFATNDLNNPRGKHWHPDTPGNRTTRHLSLIHISEPTRRS